MSVQTNTANTNDWLAATEGVEIKADVDYDIAIQMTPREIRTIELHVTAISKAEPRLFASDWDEAATEVLRDRADAWRRLAE